MAVVVDFITEAVGRATLTSVPTSDDAPAELVHLILTLPADIPLYGRVCRNRVRALTSGCRVRSRLGNANRQASAINPLAATRYCDRRSASRAEPDPVDALVLANILRTNTAAH
ncbi:hypothetical protein [Nocardiopsis synnemataformans]|uniref:hypothetical protein n=1 Tax=Nocardiopsis synnemataformans TaxID=61305 RepID=UPI003EB9C864